MHPHARRGLLLNWNESRSYREEIAAAFAQRQAEGFVTKPSGTPDERFHRSITELLDEWWRIRGPRTTAVHIVGAARTARVYEMCDLLQRHNMPFAFQRADSEAGAAILQTAGVDADTAPVVVLQDGRTFVDPSNIEIADALGARTRPGSGIYDLIVVGGGPAGLSAAVYAESEGLRTALIEPTAMGGQAGTSSMIRNYLGFPRGISGAELAARAFDQAILFGTEMIYGHAAAGLRVDGGLRIVQLTDGTDVPARAVVIATGVSYRTLDIAVARGVQRCRRLLRSREFRGGRPRRPGRVRGRRRKLRRPSSRVPRQVRVSRHDPRAGRVTGPEHVRVPHHRDRRDSATSTSCAGSRSSAGPGDGRLETIDIRRSSSGAVDTLPAAALFILIGAEPFTQWLPPDVARDDWGFVMTGPTEEAPSRLPFESTLPGVFAVGDVRTRLDQARRVGCRRRRRVRTARARVPRRPTRSFDEHDRQPRLPTEQVEAPATQTARLAHGRNAPEPDPSRIDATVAHNL